MVKGYSRGRGRPKIIGKEIVPIGLRPVYKSTGEFGHCIYYWSD